MNIKDFKNVTTKPCDIEFDEKYLKKLSQLPKTSPKRHTIEIISTIAAAVLIVVAVSLWALIGRGVRESGVQVVAGSYAETEVTSELNAQLNMDLFGKYDVFCFREFDEKNPLSVHELLQINRYAENAFYKGTEGYVTGKMINDYAKKMFGISPAHDFAIYGCVTELGDVDYAGAKTTKITTEDLTDGTKKIHIEYTEFIHKYVLEYVGYDLFSPIRFTAFYKDDTELSKTYADAQIYKVLCSELDADPNIESYLLYLPEAPTETDDGYSAKIILPDYSFADGKPHSILGRIEEFKPHQTAELTLNFKKTEDGLQLIKEKTDGQSVFIQKLNTHYDNGWYSVSKENAEYLSALVKKESVDSECYCVYNYKIVADGKEYNVVLGDEFASHIACNGKKYTLTPDEYTALSRIIDESVTKQNFVKYLTDRDKYVSSGATEVKITINDDMMPQRNGTYTISAEQEPNLVGWIEENSFAHDTLKFLPSVKLEVGERTYYLHMGDKPFLRSSCGQCPLSNDDAVLMYVQAYTGYGWYGDGKGFYENDDGHFETTDYGKTFEKYITRKEAIRIANAEAKKDKYNYQGWDCDFYLDENSKKVYLTTDYNGGWWQEKWKTEYYREGALCWEVRLSDNNDSLISLFLYIDAKTGNVVGGAELSD